MSGRVPTKIVVFYFSNPIHLCAHHSMSLSLRFFAMGMYDSRLMRGYLDWAKDLTCQGNGDLLTIPPTKFRQSCHQIYDCHVFFKANGTWNQAESLACKKEKSPFSFLFLSYFICWTYFPGFLQTSRICICYGQNWKYSSGKSRAVHSTRQGR